MRNLVWMAAGVFASVLSIGCGEGITSPSAAPKPVAVATDQAQDNIVWGSSRSENIVWGSARTEAQASSSDLIIWGD